MKLTFDNATAADVDGGMGLGFDAPSIQPVVVDADAATAEVSPDAAAPPPDEHHPLIRGWRPCKVVRVYYGDTPTHWSGDKRAIDCVAVRPYNYVDSKAWEGEEFFAGVLPADMNADQALYQVEVDQVVWVGNVGEQAYYRTSWEPFYGRVIDADNSTYIKVRWQAIAGNPTSAVFTLSDLSASFSGTNYLTPRPGGSVTDSEYMDFNYVVPLRALRSEPHGLVASDTVLVVQRGRYLTCITEKPVVFPVELTQVGGSNGTAGGPATWTYDITSAIGVTATLATAVDPTSGVHKWVRPEVGAMQDATFGLAYRTTSGSVALTWTNEQISASPCAN